MSSYIASLMLSHIEIFPYMVKECCFFQLTGNMTQVPGAIHLTEPSGLPDSVKINRKLEIIRKSPMEMLKLFKKKKRER